MKRHVDALSIDIGVCEQDWKRNPEPLTDAQLGYWLRYEVDGKPIEEGLDTDFGEVVWATTHVITKNGSGILTCGCGVPWCAGIEECVRVQHQGRFVFWTFRRPMVAGFGKHNVRNWRSKARKVRFRFLRSQLMAVCRSAAERLEIKPDTNFENKNFIGSDSLSSLLEQGHGKWIFQGGAK